MKYLSILVVTWLMTGCQTSGEPKPAVLESADVETVTHLKSTIALAMQKARIEFGPGDLTTSPQIAVLPPRLGPHETHSVAVPTYFDLALKNGVCVVIRRETGAVFEVPNARCKLLDD